ncbi:lipase [Russula compacta]|nr:lipase [Russula compacta]
MPLRSIIIATVVGLVYAATPTRHQPFPTLTPEQVSSYSPYTHYVAAVGCGLDYIWDWSCEYHCEETSDFQVFDAGGNGTSQPYWFVGYDQDRDTVIVAHQGTNFSSKDSTDILLELGLVSLDFSLFPGVSDTIRVHKGFSRIQAQTATRVLSDVQKLIAAHGTSTVTTVGHSLGAALSLLDGVYLRLHLAADVDVRYIGYGQPRVGNPAWANYVDALLLDKLSRVNNKKDPVPQLPYKWPLMGFDYYHSSGEIHIQESEEWVECPGQENNSTFCSDGSSPDFSPDNKDHIIGYNNINITCLDSEASGIPLVADTNQLPLSNSRMRTGACRSAAST